MIIVFDIGNTNITFGVFDGKKLLFESRIQTETGKMPDQYAVEIKHILSHHNCGREFEGGVICSVVPALTQTIATAVRDSFQIEPLIVGPGIKTGLNIKIDNPSQLGADLAAGAVGAVSQYDPPLIIFDLGTATKASVILKDGTFVGGLIMSGIGISLEALSAKTAQLPYIGLARPNKVVGSNTIDCMESGLIHGTAAMIDGIIERIKEEQNSDFTVLLTGGLSRIVGEFCKSKPIYLPNLVLEGLRVIYEKNNPKS